MTSERDLMREEFEALCVKRWRGDRDGLLRNPDGTYILGPAQFAWEMFQAARRAQHSTAEPVAEVEQSGMTFEQWYAQYHEDACVMYGGLSGNPKDVAHDAWDAARAIEAANGIGTKEAEHDD